MNEKILALQNEIDEKLSTVSDLTELDSIRVAYLGKKGSITALLKGMKDLSVEEKKTFGAEVNTLKEYATNKLEEKTLELKEKEIAAEIAAMPLIDVTAPADTDRGSYHPITLVQRQCEAIFKSMGFTVEDYPEVVTDYECFEALNIPKHHPARDMQDTYYLSNGQLLKTHTSAAQNAILKKYGKNL
ncbi:MAG: phenylalanine--tRNA ligase subunit alpha, partial [Clostridia bacterium]|nr:phenylalanine--tRNA ligase subunit alpha [Clostridia bacterium]